MFQNVSRALAVGLWSLAVWALPAQAQPPQRVVSLLPSLTETVCALGACDRLVGVDTYSNFPASVKALPHVGSGLSPQLETLVALKPDLVLVANSSPALERLRSLGLRVIALEPKTHADVKRTVAQLGEVFGVAAAQQLQRQMEQDLQRVAASLPAAVRKVRVYFEVSRAPYAASESSFIGETLTALGAQNVVPGRLGPFPKINPEFVVRANPDLIMLSDSEVASLQERPGWRAVQALARQRLCLFDAEQGDMLVRAGPRMAEGARLMAECLRRYVP